MRTLSNTCKLGDHLARSCCKRPNIFLNNTHSCPIPSFHNSPQLVRHMDKLTESTQCFEINQQKFELRQAQQMFALEQQQQKFELEKQREDLKNQQIKLEQRELLLIQQQRQFEIYLQRIQPFSIEFFSSNGGIEGLEREDDINKHEDEKSSLNSSGEDDGENKMKAENHNNDSKTLHTEDINSSTPQSQLLPQLTQNTMDIPNQALDDVLEMYVNKLNVFGKALKSTVKQLALNNKNNSFIVSQQFKKANEIFNYAAAVVSDLNLPIINTEESIAKQRVVLHKCLWRIFLKKWLKTTVEVTITLVEDGNEENRIKYTVGTSKTCRSNGAIGTTIKQLFSQGEKGESCLDCHFSLSTPLIDQGEWFNLDDIGVHDVFLLSPLDLTIDQSAFNGNDIKVDASQHIVKVKRGAVATKKVEKTVEKEPEQKVPE